MLVSGASNFFFGTRYINSFGIKLFSDKVDAIKNFTQLCTVKELRRFLDLVNYYCRFLKSVPPTLAPLNDLLTKVKVNKLKF